MRKPLFTRYRIFADIRNFIVDANDSRSARKSSKKTIIHDDPLTQEAQELFGVDLEDLEELNFNQLDEDDYSEDELDSNVDFLRYALSIIVCRFAGGFVDDQDA